MSATNDKTNPQSKNTEQVDNMHTFPPTPERTVWIGEKFNIDYKYLIKLLFAFTNPEKTITAHLTDIQLNIYLGILWNLGYIDILENTEIPSFKITNRGISYTNFANKEIEKGTFTL